MKKSTASLDSGKPDQAQEILGQLENGLAVLRPAKNPDCAKSQGVAGNDRPLKASLAKRTEPKNEEDSDLVFITMYHNSWSNNTTGNPVSLMLLDGYA